MANTIFNAATGSATGFRYIPETVLGTTPAVTSANIFNVRNNGSTLSVTKGSLKSDELRDDRMPGDVKHGNIKVGGDLTVPFMYKEYDPFLEAVCFGAWNTNVLKCAKAIKSFTIERPFTNMDVPQYGQYTGVMFDSFNLSIKPEQMVIGKFTMVGITGAYSSTSLLSTGSPTASQTSTPYDSFSGSIKEGGSVISVVTDLSIDIKNAITPAYVIGQNVAGALPAGRSAVSGSLTCMFTDVTMLNKFMNETTSSLEFILGPATFGAAESAYKFLVPKIKYMSGQPDVSGEGLISLTMQWEAMFDSTTGTNLQITRTAS